MVEKFGKKVYIIAADYNFGQISAEWNRKLVKEQGGTVVGEEFIPLGVSQFAPDHPEHPEGQAGLAADHQSSAPRRTRSSSRRRPPSSDLPMGISIKIMLGFEHKRFAPPALNEHACRGQLVRGDSTRRKPRSSRSAGTPSSPTSPTSTTWATTPTSRSIMYKKLVEKAEVDQARRHAQGDRHRRGLHRRAGGQGLHRSEEPAHLPTACG